VGKGNAHCPESSTTPPPPPSGCSCAAERRPSWPRSRRS
jgi:hypothetical protein